jgi:hypothetical protein
MTSLPVPFFCLHCNDWGRALCMPKSPLPPLHVVAPQWWWAPRWRPLRSTEVPSVAGGAGIAAGDAQAGASPATPMLAAAAAASERGGGAVEVAATRARVHLVYSESDGVSEEVGVRVRGGSTSSGWAAGRGRAATTRWQRACVLDLRAGAVTTVSETTRVPDPTARPADESPADYLMPMQRQRSALPPPQGYGGGHP